MRKQRRAGTEVERESLFSSRRSHLSLVLLVFYHSRCLSRLPLVHGADYSSTSVFAMGNKSSSLKKSRSKSTPKNKKFSTGRSPSSSNNMGRRSRSSAKNGDPDVVVLDATDDDSRSAPKASTSKGKAPAKKTPGPKSATRGRPKSRSVSAARERSPTPSSSRSESVSRESRPRAKKAVVGPASEKAKSKYVEPSSESEPDDTVEEQSESAAASNASLNSSVQETRPGPKSKKSLLLKNSSAETPEQVDSSKPGPKSAKKTNGETSSGRSLSLASVESVPLTKSVASSSLATPDLQSTPGPKSKKKRQAPQPPKASSGKIKTSALFGNATPGSSKASSKTKAKTNDIVGPLSSPVKKVEIPRDAEVEAILQRWYGMSDQNTRECFYLVKFKGYPTPEYDDNDAWKHTRDLPHALDKVEEFEEQQKIKDAEKKAKKQTWTYVDEDDLKATNVGDAVFGEIAEKAKRDALEGKGRSTRPKDHINLNENKMGRQIAKARRCGSVSSNSTSNAREEEVGGWDRGLSPDCIVGAMEHKGHVLYLMKWKTVEEADLVLSIDCLEKCPDLVIEFLERNMQETMIIRN